MSDLSPAALSISFVCAEAVGNGRDGEPAMLFVVSDEDGGEVGQVAFDTEEITRLHAMLGAWLAHGGRVNAASKIAFLEAGVEPTPGERATS